MPGILSRWLVGLLLPLGLFGQQLPLQHYTTDAEINPLPVSAVVALCQDEVGYIWMSTYSHGLLQYDGQALVEYRAETDSVPENAWALFQSASGHIWAAGNEGYRVSTLPSGADLSGQPLRWSARYGRHLLPDLLIADPQMMVDGPDDRVWLSLDDRILRLPSRPDSPEAPDTLSLPFGPDEYLRAMYRQGPGEVWLSSSEPGLYVYRQATGRITRIGAYPAGEAGATAYLTEADGRLWGGTDRGVVWRLDSLGGEARLTLFPLDTRAALLSLADAGNGYLLAATRGEGLFALPLSGDGPTRRYGRSEGLLHPVIWALQRDREGNIWLAQNAGVSRLRADYLAFGHYGAEAIGNEAPVLPGPGVNVVLPDARLDEDDPNGLLLAGTSNGLAIIGPDGSHQVLGEAEGLPSPILYSLAQTSRRLWASTDRGLVCIARRRADLAFPRAGPPRRIPWPGGRSAYLARVFPDRAYRYLFTLPGRSGSEEPWLLAAGRSDLLIRTADRWYQLDTLAGLSPRPGIQGAALDAAGHLLLGKGGFTLLRSLAPLDETRLRAASAPYETTGRWRVGDTLFAPLPLTWEGDELTPGGPLAATGRQIWVPTRRGLLRLEGDPPRAVSLLHQETDGQEEFQFSALLPDPQRGLLWAGAQTGLYGLGLEDGRLKVQVDRNDGLVNSQIWGSQALGLDQRGQVYFGTPRGLSVYRPGRDDTLRVAPQPAFRRVNFEEDAWGNNSIQFEYAALSFAREKEVRYRSRLVGYDRGWSNDTTASSVRYTNLPAFLIPRTYTFEVLAANPDGVWSSDPLRYRFTVAPPWWQRWWAFVILAGLGAIGIRAYIARRLREQERALAKERLVSERLREVDRLKDQFLANTSHELRTPLNGIIGLADGLLGGIAGQLPAVAADKLAMISASGQRLANLVNDILDFSRLKNEEIALRLAPVDLYAAVDVVLTLSQPLVRDKPIELHNRVDRDLPPVLADEDRLQQILHNLVGNAIKFTSQGEVAVSAEARQDAIAVHVRDTGIGIAEDVQEKIFQSFQQADGDVARRYGGTGLGLTISRQLLRLQGGDLQLRSTPGKGSTFTFTLPRYTGKEKPEPTARPVSRTIDRQWAAPAAPAKDTPGPAASPPAAGGRKGHVLVVDDEPVNLQVMADHLTLGGYQVTRASSGRQALDCLDRGDPIDLVLLDVMMPHMSGFEVCARIRERYLPSALPVVLVTAKNQVNDLVQGFEAGANDYITKPCSRDELLSRVQTHLRLQRIHTATGKFVPHEFLRSIGRETIMEARLGDQTEQEVTVLFTDIRDYTTLSESMTPDQTFRFVNAYNRRIGPVIRQHRGFVNQYLGDAIMALFPRAPADALGAAIAMQERLHQYNEERRKTGRMAIRTGIGIHTGSLIMGIIGDDSRLDAATISDTVNTAARIESLTKHYDARILLSETTLDPGTTESPYHTRYLGQVRVKGKQDSVRIFECVDGDPAPVRDRKIATLEAFEAASAAYYARRFDEAHRGFAAIVGQNPDDGAAHLFLNRSRRYLQAGPPPDWTGTEVMERK